MKIIGKDKGRAPKAWCLIQNTKTGHYFVGYDGEWPVHGNAAQVQAQVDEAIAYIAANPRPIELPEVPFPGHVDFRKKLEDYPEEFQVKKKAYDAHSASRYAANQWDKQELIANCVPLSHMPVFEDELRFVGYTRGRSSVTMKFESTNGQMIEFGPSGIDGLIQGIIAGTCVPVELTGTYVENKWDNDAQESFPVTIPRGRGIKAVFKITKKGANVYAELTEL